MSNPIVPNYNPNVGRLSTDRYDFQGHIDGYSFRHIASNIDLSPNIVIGGHNTTNVQTAITALSNLILPPVVANATLTSLGIIRLGGDLAGASSTAISPVVSGLQGYPIAPTHPTSGNVLTWIGSAWSPAPPPVTFLPGNDLFGNSTSQNVIGLTGTGISPNSTINAKCDIINFISTATPQITQTISTTGNGTNLSLTAQSATAGTSASGGIVSIKGGAAGGSGDTPINGGVNLQLGDGTYLVEATQTINGKVLSLVGKTTFTSSTATGDGIIFIGNSTSPATGNPVGGAVLYAASGVLNVVQSDGQNFPITSRAYTLPTYNVSGTYNISTSDCVLFVDTSALRTIRLPTPAAGRTIIIKDITGQANIHNISLLQNGSEKIEGLAATKLLSTNWGCWTLISNNIDWYFV